MLYIIKRSNGVYFHNKGRIILFESKEDAENFINMFIQYSTNRLISENRANEAMQAPMIIVSSCIIMPIDFNIDNVECGTIYMSDLFNREGK